jgi:hypothetical protein
VLNLSANHDLARDILLDYKVFSSIYIDSYLFSKRYLKSHFSIRFLESDGELGKELLDLN